MDSTAYRGGWLVYFNGIEIPVLSVNTGVAVGNFPQATVALAPDVTMKRIGAEDRVRMTVFFLDSIRPTLDTGSGSRPTWRLLFDGEIVSWGWSYSPQGRSLTYTAVDPLEALGRIQPSLWSSLDSIGVDRVATDGVGISGVVNPWAPGYSLLKKGLRGQERDIERPFDFLENVLNILGYVDEDTLTPRSAMLRYWYAPWEARTRFSDRFVPSHVVETLPRRDGGVFPVLEAAQTEQAFAALKDTVNVIGSEASVFAMIMTVFQLCYYELSMILAPPFMRVNSRTKDVEEWEAPDSQEETRQRGTVNPEGITGLDSTVYTIGSYHTKPQTIFGAVPAFNVVWPAMGATVSYDENLAAQPTRIHVGDYYQFRLVAGDNAHRLSPTMRALTEKALSVGYPEEADVFLRKPVANRNPSDFMVYPEEYFKGPVPYNAEMPPLLAVMAMATRPEDVVVEEGNPASRYVGYREGMNARPVAKTYARTELLRMRYMHRNGGASMSFNPYMVPGHPCAFIDEEESNFHLFGYVTQIQHQLSQQGMNTQVGYSYGQLFDEFFENVAQDALEAGRAPSRIATGTTYMAPLHPIEELQDIFSKVENAEEYYNAMFWRRDPASAQEEKVFDWQKIVGVRAMEDVLAHTSGANLDDLEIEPLEFHLDDDGRIVGNALADENVGYVPRYAIKPSYRANLDDPAAAMRWVSRPITTLDEWIDFHPNGVRLQPVTGTDPYQGRGAAFWTKILELTPGPGLEPGTTSDGTPEGPAAAHTRKNWEDRFVEYRHKVYFQKRPHRA